MLACPDHAPDRNELTNKLKELYPLYEQRTRNLTPSSEHTEWLLWYIPDGKLLYLYSTNPILSSSTTADKTRVAATHAVLKYRRKAAYRHPQMNRMVFTKDSSF